MTSYMKKQPKIDSDIWKVSNCSIIFNRRINALGPEKK